MQRDEYNKVIIACDASRLRIGIVVSRFNSDITEAMLDGAIKTLKTWNVSTDNIFISHVPGGFELPLGCKRMIERHNVNAVVAIGCVIKGDTKHDEYISSAVSHGITSIQIESGIPIAFGVITPNNLDQAKERSTGQMNKGIEAAIVAMEMALDTGI